MAHRIFVDAIGVEWQVWAVIPTLAKREPRHSPAQSHAAVRQELLSGWLAFQTDGAGGGPAATYRVTSPYSALKALREALALASTNAFADFCLVLEQYVAEGADESTLHDSARAIAMETRRRDLPLERMLHGLRVSRCVVTVAPTDTAGRTAERRYHHALSLYLRFYFVV